ncbi:hypothetical protein [Azospirillum sp. sgz302134]
MICVKRPNGAYIGGHSIVHASRYGGLGRAGSEDTGALYSSGLKDDERAWANYILDCLKCGCAWPIINNRRIVDQIDACGGPKAWAERILRPKSRVPKHRHS